MIDRIEIFVTALSARVQRIFSSGSYDTGPAERLLSKPVLVKIYADGVVGCAQIRPISPGHFVADTTHSVVAAIKEIYGPALIGKIDLRHRVDQRDVRQPAREQSGCARRARHRGARRDGQSAQYAALQPDRRLLPAAHTARMVGQHGRRRRDDGRGSEARGRRVRHPRAVPQDGRPPRLAAGREELRSGAQGAGRRRDDRRRSEHRLDAGRCAVRRSGS